MNVFFILSPSVLRAVSYCVSSYLANRYYFDCVPGVDNVSQAETDTQSKKETVNFTELKIELFHSHSNEKADSC